MTPEAKQAYDLVLEIRNVESEIQQFEETKRKLESQLERLIGGSNASIGGTAKLKITGSHLGHTSRRGRVASDNSAQKRIERLLNEFPEMEFDAGMVAKELAMNFGTAKTNLSKLTRLKVIEKRSFNTYGSTQQEKEAPKEEAS